VQTVLTVGSIDRADVRALTLSDVSGAATPYPEISRIAAQSGSVLVVSVGSIEQTDTTSRR
jgi:hypothetical protein